MLYFTYKPPIPEVSVTPILALGDVKKKIGCRGVRIA